MRATISFGPNFAYALCVKRIRDADLEGLDLSTLARRRAAAPSPFAPADLERVRRQVRDGRLRPSARCLPCYGMAESTLAISFTALGEGVRTIAVDGETSGWRGQGRRPSPSRTRAGALRLVSCGTTFEGHEIAVFAPTTTRAATPLADGYVGELRIRGPSVMTGYCDEPELTARGVRRRLAAHR